MDDTDHERPKSERLEEGADALESLEPVGRTSYEGGDGAIGDPDWHHDYRVWPAKGYEKADVAEAVENHYGDGYILTISPTRGDEYLYVSVRTA